MTISNLENFKVEFRSLAPLKAIIVMFATLCGCDKIQDKHDAVITSYSQTTHYDPRWIINFRDKDGKTGSIKTPYSITTAGPGQGCMIGHHLLVVSSGEKTLEPVDASECQPVAEEG